jgi:hypothetical protein
MSPVCYILFPISCRKDAVAALTGPFSGKGLRKWISHVVPLNEEGEVSLASVDEREERGQTDDTTLSGFIVDDDKSIETLSESASIQEPAQYVHQLLATSAMHCIRNVPV